MAEVVYAGQISREAPELEAYKLGLLQAAQKQVAQPLSLPAYQSAGLQGLQQEAVNLGQQYGQGGTGVGGYAPYLQGAGQTLGAAAAGTMAGMQGASGVNVDPYFAQAQQGMGASAQVAGQMGQLAQLAGAGYGNIAQGGQTMGTAGQALMGSAQGFDPSRGIGAFMNPYQQQVIDEALKQINRQGDIAQQNLSAQAIRTGAFGGTREGVQRAELGRNIAEMQNQAILGGLQQGYGQALGAAQQAFEAQQGRQFGVGQALGQLGQMQSQQGLMGSQIAGQQAGILGNQAQLYQQAAQGIGGLAGQQGQLGLARASTLGQLGQGLGQIGQQQAGLGAQAQALAQGDLNTYLTLGGLQQQAEQSRLDAFRATEMQRSMMPYQQLGFMSDIYKGIPSSSSTLTGMTGPSTNPLVSAIGTAAGAIGAAKGLF
jgi:hypothetical protein